MWTTKNRARYDRSRLRYPSDLTDAEWDLIAPLIPPAKRGGNKRTVDLREIVNGLDVRLEHRLPVAGDPEGPAAALHIARLSRPVELGRNARPHPFRALRSMPRTRRPRSLSHRCRDRQSERERRGKRGRCIDPHGFDAGKKIKGKKRHILVDTQGLLMHAIVHGADIQDRDGGVLLMATLFGVYPFLLKLYADGGYQGEKFEAALKKVVSGLNVEIVKRSDQAKGFVVLPKRWVVERTFAWLGRCRRLAKDWECLTRKALAFLKLASIRLMLRKLCNPA